MQGSSTAQFGNGFAYVAAVLAASVAGLAAAFAGEYLFGLEPCILCLYERVPYTVAAVLSLTALAAPRRGLARPVLLALAGVVFFAGAGLALFHVGVEEHWWGSIAACGGQLPAGAEAEDLRNLTPSDLKPCDRVDWRMFGISLAGYNALYSLALAGLCAAGVRALTRKA